MRQTIFLAAVAVLSSGAFAQQIGDRATLNSFLTSSTTDDFENYRVADGAADTLGVTTMDASTVANGQGPGLVNAGVSYSDVTQSNLQWNGDGYFGLETKTFLSNGGGLIQIDYSSAVQAMGLDAMGFSGFGYDGVMDVYNGGTLLGSVTFSIAGGGAESVFLGYQNAGGITQVQIHSATFPWSPVIDDHTFGVVPEPATMAVLGIALTALPRRRKK